MIGVAVNLELDKTGKPDYSNVELYAYGTTLVGKANWLRVAKGQDPLYPQDSQDPTSVIQKLLDEYVSSKATQKDTKSKYEHAFWSKVQEAFKSISAGDRRKVNDLFLNRQPEQKVVVEGNSYKMKNLE